MSRFHFPKALCVGLVFAVCAVCVATAQTPSGAQGRSYSEIAQLPDFTGAWALDHFNNFNQSDEPIPLKPPYDGMMAELRRITHTPGGDVPSNSKLCMPNGPSMLAPGRLYEFLYTPGQVTIIPQNNGVRRIYTDGRAHPAHYPLSFDGHSTGHWEGKTLVVETVGLRKESEFIHALRSQDANKTVTIVERFSLSAPDHMRIETTLTSPVVFSAPFIFRANYSRVPYPVMEEICSENNLAIDPATGEQVFPSAPANDHTGISSGISKE